MPEAKPTTEDSVVFSGYNHVAHVFTINLTKWISYKRGIRNSRSTNHNFSYYSLERWTSAQRKSRACFR